MYELPWLPSIDGEITVDAASLVCEGHDGPALRRNSFHLAGNSFFSDQDVPQPLEGVEGV